jgi:hypothetical protein
MIKAADHWRNNGELIADVAKLWFPEFDNVIDLTYGKGTWWKKYLPWMITTNDLDPATEAHYNEDFRATSQHADTYDVVAFDPPYVAIGGRETSTIKDHHARYGMESGNPLATQKLINAGLTEAQRICKPGGIILCKCANYISSGKYQAGVFDTWEYGVNALYLDLVDQFILVGEPGRQSQTTQVHARNNYSCLLVFRKPS